MPKIASKHGGKMMTIFSIPFSDKLITPSLGWSKQNKTHTHTYMVKEEKHKILIDGCN
jgi:hypothetical protein